MDIKTIFIKTMKSLDWRGLILFGMSVTNLLFMHYYSLLTLVFENNPGAGYVKNLLGTLKIRAFRLCNTTAAAALTCCCPRCR